MGLPDAEIARLGTEYPSLRVLARQSTLWRRSGLVLAVKVSIAGIRGRGSKLPCRYDLILDTGSLAESIPEVWVTSPLDSEIRHVNIWPARQSFCRWTGCNLPSFCWYGFDGAWAAAPHSSRTLGAVLEYAKQFLTTENHDSSAR